MKSALQKITVTFVLICLIPVGFIIYEFSSLSDNEKMVTSIYHNQLDAILYSVNQYTDDVFSSWASKIDISLLKDTTRIVPSQIVEDLKNEFSLSSSVREMYFSDLKGGGVAIRFTDSVSHERIYPSMVAALGDRIIKLKTHQRGGFRKIEALDTLVEGQFIPIFFLLNEKVSSHRLAILLVDLNAFVQNVLGPKLQAISRDEFVISAFEKKGNTLIYSTEVSHPAASQSEVQRAESQKEVTEKELWLLPGYYLTISLRDTTITELVKQRVETSMLIFAVLFLLLIGGILFLYANIRREILLSQSKSEFVSNVSHEIRTPLSLISMYAETLEMGRVPEERKKEYYHIIVNETARLSGIVNRILNFARVDASKKKFEYKTVDLNALCEKIAWSYQPHMKEKGFEFQFVPFDSAVHVRADEESVTEAILNLLDNAMKYSQDEKKVSLRTGMNGLQAFVEVEDRGIGIPKVYQGNIFDQFYRVPTNNVHNIKGTGLGLTLVKRTMAAHKGKVKVASTPGKGSTFTLSFPLMNDTENSGANKEK
jgi:two-component system, OmpR family, phosphate regulon sensor histidine kinase PhoR